MKKIITIALLALSFSASAQKMGRKEVVKYNTMNIIDSQELKHGGTVYLYKDGSGKMAFIGQVGLGVEVSASDLFKLNLRAEGDYFFKKWISLHAEYEYSLIDRESIMANTYASSDPNLNLTAVNHSNYMEGGIRVLVMDWKKKVKRHVVLETRGGYKSTTEYFINPKLPARRMVAVRAGVNSHSTVVNYLLKSDPGAVVSQDGFVLGKFYTNSHSRGAYLGISSITLIDAITKNSFKRGSMYISRNFREFYADILFAGTTFDPVTDENGVHPIVANATGSFQTSPIGARIGIRNTVENGKLDFGYKIELGSRPGVKDAGFYVNAGMSWAIVK
jgi:hypothetical protein